MKRTIFKFLMICVIVSPAGGGYMVNQSAPVGTYPAGASPYGCMDMTGNAYEWCADWAKSYPGSAGVGPGESDIIGFRMAR